MRKFTLFLISLLGIINLAIAQPQEKWKSANSTHFIAYYKNAPEDFIKEVMDKSEDYYNKIADELGFRRFDFWLWDNRARIYIYDNPADYQASCGQPSWSGGYAVTKKKLIATFPYAQDFTETILAHEIGHIIFREFVGFDNYAIPLWLEEGVASYQEKRKYSLAQKSMKEAISQGKFIDIPELSAVSPLAAQDSHAVEIFYAEAFSIVDYLIKEFGRDRFVLFCQNLRDKKDLEAAVSAAYRFESLEKLNDAWKRYLEK